MGESASPELAEKITANMMRAPEATAVQSAQWLIDPRVMKSDDRFSVPALIVSHDAKRLPKELVGRILPNGRIATVENSGHFLMMERPAEFNAILADFLAALERP